MTITDNLKNDISNENEGIQEKKKKHMIIKKRETYSVISIYIYNIL